jgi:hypothetical protein
VDEAGLWQEDRAGAVQAVQAHTLEAREWEVPAKEEREAGVEAAPAQVAPSCSVVREVLVVEAAQGDLCLVVPAGEVVREGLSSEERGAGAERVWAGHPMVQEEEVGLRWAWMGPWAVPAQQVL